MTTGAFICDFPTIRVTKSFEYNPAGDFMYMYSSVLKNEYVFTKHGHKR